MISDARGSHVSPGIYTEERDVTYSVKSLGITSVALVGETLYGPAFQNIEIEKWGDYVDYFGGTSTEKFKGNRMPKYGLPYIAKSYLEESKRLNVVRVLGLSGYNAGPAWPIIINKQVAVVLRSKMAYNESNTDDICGTSTVKAQALVENVTVTKYEDNIQNSICPGDTPKGDTPKGDTLNVDTPKFTIKATIKDKGDIEYNVTLNPSDSNYIYKVLGDNPESDNAYLYIEAVYEKNIKKEEGNTPFNYSCFKCDNNEYSNFYSSYRYAQTPWIVSNVVNGEMRKLFKFITISDGTNANYQVKVSIQNIKPSEGVFDVVVRDFNDSDSNPIILEKFSKCNLIPGDANYIAYKIGDLDGGYEVKSKYIIVAMADEYTDYSNAIPAGFIGYPMPKYSSGETDYTYDLDYNTEYDPSIKSKRQYFGASNIDIDVFSYKGVNWYNALNMDADSEKLTSGFHMDSTVSAGTIDNEIYKFKSVSDKKVTNHLYVPRFVANEDIMNETIYEDTELRKFTICFYGGFDGWDINRKERTNTDAYKATKYKSDDIFKVIDSSLGLNLPSTAITSDYYAYLAGCRVFANPQDIDINILATPGINWYDHNLLTEEIIDMIEDKDYGRGGDALYVMESPNSGDAKTVADNFKETGINSSYACTYFPWVMYYDKLNKKYLDLPVTKDVVRNMAHTDNTAYPWFAPAGMQRGNVECIKAKFKTTLADEDALYEVGINPIKSYAQDGVKIWGNKTVYNIESPLNRINVRRLQIRVKKLIMEASKHLIFEQYDETLETQFKGLVEPILADIKANRGIIDYRIIVESTPEARDQHILPAKILIKPTQSLEYISISFVVYPNSVDFEK